TRGKPPCYSNRKANGNWEPPAGGAGARVRILHKRAAVVKRRHLSLLPGSKEERCDVLCPPSGQQQKPCKAGKGPRRGPWCPRIRQTPCDAVWSAQSSRTADAGVENRAAVRIYVSESQEL